MTDDRPESVQAVTAAFRALTSAYTDAAEAVDAVENPQQAFELATELASVLRELADAGAELRARAVARIWDAEQMSLAGLAQRIGVSKARADQLLKTAKTAKESPNV